MDWTPSRRLYAAEFKNGVIKVGITGQLGARRTDYLRFNGAGPVRAHYGDKHLCGYWAERELLERVLRIAHRVNGTREWFVGIGYGAACTLVNQITRNALVLDKASA